MAPSYDNLPENGSDDEEEQLDFSDLDAQYEVRLDEGFDTFVVIDGIPVVNEESKSKLLKFLLRKLNSVGTVAGDVFMPMNETGNSDGYAFVEYETAEQATEAVKKLHGTALDKRHTMAVNKITDIERYGREGKISDEYVSPTIEDFKEKEHLRWWIGDEEGRDQFLLSHSDNVAVCWNEKDEQPDEVVNRQHWTETFTAWSPEGTYLASMHVQGVQLWGGESWTRLKRFVHPGVNLVDFSPNEKYLTTWSHRPLTVDENTPILTAEEDGKNYIVWDIATCKPLRSFTNLDPPGPSVDEAGNPIKKKLQWPAFKWSADDKYVARLVSGQSVSVYELPRMNLLDKQSVKIDGVVDFDWSPASAQRDGIKTDEQLFCFWTPEAGSNPAKVGLMSIPSKEIVRTRNLFNVSDAKLHWQSQGKYVCVKVDRHSKSKKSLATVLEIFRVREKGVPVEVIDTIKETVINFAWEPQGDRFVIITLGEVLAAAAVAPKTSVSFYAPEKAKGPIPGGFKHVKTLEKRNTNAIYWSPKGRFVAVATVQSTQSFEIDFWDCDYEGEKKDEGEKELAANLQFMSAGDHYGVTDVEWDPSGRYLATSASMWKNAMESGYRIYDFKGTLLRDEHIDRFKQFSWRPRPPTLLSKEEQKTIRRNLREYSKIFDEQDQSRRNTANKAVLEQRRRLLDEWSAWRETVERDLREQREELGLPADGPGTIDAAEDDGGKDGKVIEEIQEEIIQESEEVV